MVAVLEQERARGIQDAPPRHGRRVHAAGVVIRTGAWHGGLYVGISFHWNPDPSNEEYPIGNPAIDAARCVFDAINSGDLSCLPECVTDDFVDHGSPFPLPGPGGYAQILGFVHGVL